MRALSVLSAMALLLSSAQGLSQVMCQGYECGLSLLFAVLLNEEIAVEVEDKVDMIEPPLPIPSFDAVDVLTGHRITSAYLEGKLSFLIFVDVYNFDYVYFWPPPKLPFDVLAEEIGYRTKRALSVLQKVHEGFSGAGVAVLGILKGPPGWTEKRAKALAEELGITFPLIHDEGIWKALGIDTYSHLILVADREGRVRFQGRWDDPIICGLGLDCQHLMRYLCEHLCEQGVP